MARAPAQAQREAVRRILVALNAISDSQAAIERAAALAAAFEAELSAMFIEDVNLLYMADLPGHEVVLSSGRAQATTRAAIERQMHERAEAAKAALVRAASARRLAWSFEVRRGRPSEALLEAATLADVVAAEWTGPGTSITAVFDVRRPVLAYYEGGPCAARVLALAVRAAVDRHVPLVVLVPARNAEAAEKQFTELREMLRHHQLHWQLERLPPGLPALQKRLRRAPGQVLMIEAGGKLVSGGQLRAAMSAAACEVLLVSDPRED